MPLLILKWLFGPIGRYLLIAIVVAGAFAFFRQHYIDIGWQKAINSIAAQDQAAVKEAEHAKTNVDNCFATGGDWDVSNGVCNKPDPSKP